MLPVFRLDRVFCGPGARVDHYKLEHSGGAGVGDKAELAENLAPEFFANKRMLFAVHSHFI